MRHFVTAVLLLSLALLLLAAHATRTRAESPHFVGMTTCTKSLTTGLTCSGKQP